MIYDLFVILRNITLLLYDQREYSSDEYLDLLNQPSFEFVFFVGMHNLELTIIELAYLFVLPKIMKELLK
jgi:hypothetical protein